MISSSQASTARHRCFATLAPLEAEGYTPAARAELAGGRSAFPHHLDFTRVEVIRMREEGMVYMSISGMQDKVSLRLERGALRPVDRNGSHILKPIPSLALPRHAVDVPANEHLTMLLARAIGGITTAACGLVRLKDGELAYVTRRFDRRPDGTRHLQEDGCQLDQRSMATHGKNYKYDASYERLGQLLGSCCHAAQVDLGEYFRRVVFAYAIGNGDAHLRNFSVLIEVDGLVRLAPAYDLLCTTLHLPTENPLALRLLEGDFTESFLALGFHTASDFSLLGQRIGVPNVLLDRTLARYRDPATRTAIIDLVERSFLSEVAKADYLAIVDHRLRALAQ